MIVKILGIGIAPCIAALTCPQHAKQGGHLPEIGAAKTHPGKIGCRFFHHAFKAQSPDHAHPLFGGKVLTGNDKSDPISFRIGIRHFVDGFPGQCQQMPCRSQFIFTDIFAEIIEIAKVILLPVAQHLSCEIIFTCQLLADLVGSFLLRVVREIAVDFPFDEAIRRISRHHCVGSLFCPGCLFILLILFHKGTVNFQKKL